VQHILYYNANPGENPNNEECIIPQLMELVTFTQPSAKIQFISFNYLIFSHTLVDTTTCLKGNCDGQSATFLTTAALHLNNANKVSFIHVEISHVGGYALWLESGCTNNLIHYCHIYDLGAGGIRVGIPESGNAPNPNLLSSFNTINDSA